MDDELKCPECGRDELAYTYGTAHELCLWCTECGTTLVPSIHVIDALYELMQLRARVAELETQWDGVPWEALRRMTTIMWSNRVLRGALSVSDLDPVFRWLIAHAPKEPQP